MKAILKRLTSTQLIALSFAGAILIGTLLLLLPFATKSGDCAGFMNAFFTATSSICVTGLVVQDTSTFWSVFGQVVILVLIQIGGMGVISLSALVGLLARRRIGLLERSTLQEAISAPSLGGIVRMTRFVLIFTVTVEFAGFVMMLPVFCKQFGAVGIWYSLFHSISAFCNAGFDIVGKQYSSLTAYASNPLLNISVMAMIVLGGIGFTTVRDVLKFRHHVRSYSLQTKVVLITNAFLIVLPALYFFFFEFNDKATGERLLTSVFQSVTTRTAGFNTADLTSLSDTGLGFMIFLMLIGGSPGSTAGGMKTTTLAVLILTAISVFRRKDYTKCHNRRLPEAAIKNAVALLILYFSLFFFGGVGISAIEGLPLLTCLFETASAVGTVGLTLGITPTLATGSQIILIALMYLGRVGALTLVFAAFTSRAKNGAKLPEEKITVG